tara:strand:- start:506 stop:748 length:243 start_codon:yes stop_codon:yes gene_type:complete
MIHSKEVEEAKALLKENGYYTDNLWHIDDVKANYECEDDSEAQEVLDSALTNEATMDQIWFAIRYKADYDLELTETKKGW